MKAGQEISIENWSPKEISLDPYKDFMDRVPKDGDIHPQVAFQLAVEANGLMNYYRSLKAKTELFYLRARSEYRRIFETVSIEKNDKSVADGERKAASDERVVKSREKRDYAEAYKVYMEDLMDNLERLFYLLKQRHAEGEKEAKRSDY